MMKNGIFVCVFVSMLIVGFSGVGAAIDDPISIVPDDATALITLKDDRDDVGVSYIIDLLMERLDRGEPTQKRRAIREIARLEPPEPSEIIGATFFVGGIPMPVIIVKLEGTTDGERNFDIFIRSLKTLLERWEFLETVDYLGHEIVYRPPKEEGENRDLSAYFWLDEVVVIGLDVDVLKLIIESYISKKTPMAETEKFIDMKARFVEARDGYIYLDNKDLKLAEILRRWEKEWGMSLLMSAELLDAIGFSIDIVDENSARGKAVFMARGENTSFDDVYDDIGFFNTALKRKFVAERAIYDSEITTDGKYVMLDFEVKGLKPFWAKTLEKRGRVGPIEASLAVKELERGLYLPRIIFILLMISIFLVFGLARRRSPK